jgi:hypothetical protein
MKYALLVYDRASSWHNLATEQKRALHGEYRAAGATPAVIAHYRLRPPQRTTTIRVEDEQTVRSEGPLDTRENLRALYVLESADQDSVLEFAARIPAARLGGAVQVWPLVSP